MADAGVPVLPGVDRRRATTPTLADAGRAIGYPVLVKAASGGGGRGMRVVHDAGRAGRGGRRGRSARRPPPSATARCSSSATSTSPRHIEVQIFGDTHGTVVHLFERECSIQRRHQKIIEEAPSPVGRRRAARTRWATPRSPRPRPSATSAPAPSSSCVDADGRVLLPRGEHPPAGRAPGHRAGHRARPGRAAARGGRRRAAARRGAATPRSRGHAIEARLYAEDVRRRVPADHRHAAPLRACRRARASGSTAAYDGRLGRRHPLRRHAGQGHRLGADPGRGRRPPGRRAARGPASTAWSPTATCWCASCATPSSWPAQTDTGFLERHPPGATSASRLDAGEAAGPRRRRRPRRRPAPARPRAAPERHPVGLAQRGPGLAAHRVGGCRRTHDRRATGSIGTACRSTRRPAPRRRRRRHLRSGHRRPQHRRDPGQRRRLAGRPGRLRRQQPGLLRAREVPRFPPPRVAASAGSLLAPMPGSVVRVDTRPAGPSGPVSP